MNKVVTFLANLGFWRFVFLMTFLVVIISELLVAIQSYWLTGAFFDTNLLVVGFVTPFINGFIFFVLIAFLIRYFKELQDEKNDMLLFQKEIEEKLRIEGERARQYLDITGTMIVALCSSGNIVLANKEACRALGYHSQEELIGQNWFEIYAPVSKREVVFKVFEEIFDGNLEPYRKYESEMLYKDGNSRLIEWNNEYIIESNGEIVGVLSSGRDITSSREAEKKLKKSESYQRAILDSFPFLVWLKDTNSDFLAVNRCFAKAAGYKEPLELIAKNDLDVWSVDLANAYRADDKEVMKSLQKKELEELIEDNGQRRWHETYKAPILDSDGTLFGTVGFARDITEIKQSQEKLKLSASVFTYAREGIIIADKKNNIVNVNEAFTNITGYSLSEVAGKNPSILQSGQNDEKFYKNLWQHLKRDGVWQGELWNKNKAGEEYAEYLTISAVYDENRVVQNYVGIFTDITEQKRQQQELEHMAHYDMLTKLPNRILFYDRMNQAIAQVMRRKHLIALAYIDIDGFKEVNDTYGHEVGDKLLIFLAERMSSLLREGDTISRVGGDEFIALLVDIESKNSVISFLDRLLEVVSQPINIDEHPINVSASIGVTFYPQNDELEVDQIIKEADSAMYKAKLSGKNCYFIFDSQSSI